MREDTEHAIQTALESFGLAFHMGREAEVMPFPGAVQRQARRKG